MLGVGVPVRERGDGARTASGCVAARVMGWESQCCWGCRGEGPVSERQGSGGDGRTFLGPVVEPTGRPRTRLRDLMTSVLREMGRGRPCSLRKRPQALQRTEPFSSRRQRGVVEVEQFWQTGWEEVD